VAVPLIFNQPLTAVFAASDPFLVTANYISLDFLYDGDGTIEWYLEFSDGSPDLATANWFREVTEAVVGSGTVNEDPATRTATVTSTSRQRSLQFVRHHKLARVQIRATASTPRVQITSVFGDKAVA